MDKEKQAAAPALIPMERITRAILLIRGQRAYNTVKHACVAARIGDGAKRGAANMSILASRATKPAPVLAATPCGLARVLAHGFVASPLLSRSKRRALLRALSQNRASASRVSRCYRL